MNASTLRAPDEVEPGAEPFLTDDPWQRLCRELTACEPPYPTDTVRWALEQREALTPHFLALLERVSRDPAAASKDDGNLYNWAYVYLAVWRDSRAWEPMLALLWQPAEVVEELLGDMLLECYGRALASVCPGDVAPLRALVLDESVQVWTRIAVLHAWRLRVQLADAAQAELEDVLLTLGEHCASVLCRSADSDATGDGPADAEVDTADLLLPFIVREAGQLHSQRLQPVIYGWFDEELVDPQTIGRDDYDWYLHRHLLQAEEGAADRHEGLIHDPVEETRWWGCWSERGEASSPLPMPWPAALPQIENPAPTTFVRTEQKVCRNDPCPCGSGKKYKKCHGGAG